MRTRKSKFYGGISGLVLPITKAKFPKEFKEKSRLEYYAHLFNSIEVNSSFYKNPQAKTVARWADCVPAQFTFTYKLSKSITHIKDLDFNEEDVEVFMEIINAGTQRKGCLLIQFPPSVTIGKLNQLQLLLSTIHHYNPAGWRLAVEFRHSSWYERELYEILTEFDATLVMHDIATSSPPEISTAKELMYIRYHGPAGNYRGDYTDEFLKTEANKIWGWLNENKTVYCYFNNTMGAAVKNLQALNDYIRKKKG